MPDFIHAKLKFWLFSVAFLPTGPKLKLDNLRILTEDEFEELLSFDIRSLDFYEDLNNNEVSDESEIKPIIDGRDIPDWAVRAPLSGYEKKAVENLHED